MATGDPELLTPHSLPIAPDRKNNFWYATDGGRVAVIFVHGIFSDSLSCWLHSTSGSHSSVFWPDLVRVDPRFGQPSVYLAGYHTSVSAGEFSIAHCAREVFDSLSRPEVVGLSRVLDYPALFFVCHSTGGVIVRYMLERFKEHFDTKAVGIALIASPSLGSVWANVASLAARYYNQQLGLQLRWSGDALQDIHGRFRDLVHRRATGFPGLVGAEAVEHHMVFRSHLPDIVMPFLPPRLKVVSTLSAGQYFGDPQVIPGTDHFSIVKPDRGSHASHNFLVSLFTEFRLSPEFRRLVPDFESRLHGAAPDWFHRPADVSSRTNQAKHTVKRPLSLFLTFAATAAAAVMLWRYWESSSCDDLFERGISEYQANRRLEAGHSFESAASCGHPLAKGWVARAKFRGSLGYRQDVDAARLEAASAANDIATAAEHGERRAEFLMAVFHEDGLGVPASLLETRRWLVRSAEHGDLMAKYALAVLMSSGALEQPPGEVNRLMTEAASGGMADAASWLARVAVQTRNYGSALQMFQRAAQLGDESADVQAGLILEQGLAGLHDSCGACQAFERAALKNDVAGAVNLGLCYDKGVAECVADGVYRFRRNSCEARKWYQRAASASPPDLKGLYNLGSLLVREECGGSIEEGLAHVRAAASGGLREAKAYLELLDK